MKEKINKKKLVKYAATSLLLATISSGCGIAIHDSSIDHRNEICPFTKMTTSISDFNSRIFNIGIQHQIKQIEDEEHDEVPKYQNRIRNIEVNTSFNHEYMEYDYKFTKVLPVVNYNYETKEVEFDVPDGYTLIYDGMWIGVKTEKTLIDTCMEFETTVSFDEYAQFFNPRPFGQIPLGWHLEEIDGEQYYVKNTTTNKVLKLK